MDTIKILICVGLLVLPSLVFGQIGKARCLPSTEPDDEFQFEFRFSRQNDMSITQLGFYDSSETPTTASPVQCVEDTVDANGILKVGFSVDGDAPLPCGITKVDDTYTITIAVDGSTPKALRFECITSGNGANINNNPANLAITNFETGPLVHKIAHRANQESVRLEVVEAYGNKVPSIEAELGELLHLRAIYDKDFRTGRDNLGSVFHVAFLSHDDAELSLNVFTPGVGTSVKVTGSLSGSTFTKYYPVKRDEVNKIVLPDSYKPASSTSTAIDPQTLAIKVEVQDTGEVVAIMALSRKRTGSPRNAGAFMVLPDDVLGTNYNCDTGNDKRGEGGQVAVYAVEDTTLTINFNTFDHSTFTIDSSPVTATQNVIMNENDVVNIQCDSRCRQITLQADKPIGVVTGHENAILTDDNWNPGRDHIVSQLPPVSTYGKRFVVIGGLKYRIILADPTDSVDIIRTSTPRLNVSSGALLNRPTGSRTSLYIFTKAVLLMVAPRPDNPVPYTMPWPSTSQWATSHYVFLEPRVPYTLTVIAQTGELTNIEVVGRDRTLDTYISSPFTPEAARGVNESEYDRVDITLEEDSPMLVELKSRDNSKPFMVYVNSSDTNFRFMSIGTRFPTVNPCVPSSNVTNSFGTGRQNTPGDMMDNDCNGLVDDQINDGTNDGSDLAANPVNPHVGIYVSSVLVSNDAMFPTDGSAVTETLITDGCSNKTAGALAISPFTWNRQIGPVFTNYHVMDTLPFRAFYLGRSRTIYFRATIGFCHGNLNDSQCDNSCQASSTVRRRRDTDEDTEETVQIETQLTIKEADVNHDTETCTMNPLYWIPAILLLLILLVEAFMTGVFIYLRISMSRNV